ncbi:MAG: transglutaminase domain-containing protein, partial [Bacteroidetes bacterium]|nr:transglutaminase domain-containing protein [Bacteroidota bacterium]
MKTIISVSVFLFCAITALGQKFEQINFYQQKYGGSEVVNTLRKTKLKIYYGENDSLKVEISKVRRKIYLRDDAAQYSSGSVYYSENRQVRSVEAYSLVPRGKRAKKEKVIDFPKKKEFSPGIFHDGSATLNFMYKSLGKGVVSVLEHTLELKVPQLLTSFYLEDYYPTESRVIEVEVENGIEVDFIYRNTDADKHKPVISETKNGKMYRWDLKDIPSYTYDNNSPGISYYTPHIIPRITSYMKGDTRVDYLGDVNDLHNWYYTLLQQTDKTASPEIKKLVDSLTSGVDDDLEKVRKIYSWLQSNVRYVAFEEGMQGFIPDDASKVCEKKYGDCKGLTSLLYSMFTYADIEAYFAWVGTRDIPYTYNDVPTPVVDNHMILAYKYKDEYYFLDGTSGTGPANTATAFIQGKEALVSKGKNNFEVVKIPIKSYDYSLFLDTIHLRLEPSGEIKGKGIMRFGGFYNSGMRSSLKWITGDRLTEFMEEYLQHGSNNFTLNKYNISDIDKNDEELKIDFE